MVSKLKTKYTIVLKDDDIIAFLHNPGGTILETCYEDQLKDKLAYWKYIINYDPEKIKQEEDKFLKRNAELNKPRRKK